MADGKDGGAHGKVRIRSFSGKASDGGVERALTVAGSLRSGGVNGPQVKAIRKNGWTPMRRKLFMETLASTCNVSEAARVAGKNLSSAYYQRRRDPAFAREWGQALSVGYGELEALLLRQSLFGSEQEDVTLDGEGVVKSRKIRRGHPHAVAVRLFLAHRSSAEAARAQEMRDQPQGEDAMDRLRAALLEVRARVAPDREE
ncbi:hypothetical protein WG907_03795 [Sphingobium sp. AN558]|uniref:hypothetical protein n=1 Tax=Sphingobium sp. AN558 TaxID=3133442 RepID=UPI0030BCDBDA